MKAFLYLTDQSDLLVYLPHIGLDVQTIFMLVIMQQILLFVSCFDDDGRYLILQLLVHL